MNVRHFKIYIWSILTNKCQFISALSLIILIIGFSHLGEVLNNIKDKSSNAIVPEPIDVVYTWVNGSDTKFRENLKSFLSKAGSHMHKDYSEERFDDKYELKFSLRSLERYAPWIRHVYILTNGQIPYWLNLDYEKVTLVTHQEIFSDPENDLPTFSSPAIETNIHKIPGLSEKFLYLNDDIFLGSETYLEDFYSLSRGYMVYLAWPLPACVPNCPWAYVGDGQCDTSCYNHECQFDGGDCSNEYDSSHVKHRHYEEGDVPEELEYDYDYNDLHPKSKFIQRNILSIAENISVTKTKSESLNQSVDLKIFSKAKRTFKNIVRNSTNISDIVKEHNANVILNDKLQRKKRYLKTSNRRKKFYKDLFSKSDKPNNVTNMTYNGYDIKSGASSNSYNLDTYALSLQHSNRVFNTIYGYRARKVPAHSPILIDKSIMEELQKKFHREFRRTCRNRIRSENDMQYSFSYYYYLISEKRTRNMSEIFDLFDTDSSNTWSDREIRTILAKLNELPLTYDMVEMFDNIIINCSKYVQLPTNVNIAKPPLYERYIDSKLPTVTKDLILHCPPLVKILEENFAIIPKYRYEIIKNSHSGSNQVMFRMLTSNVSEVIGYLDEIRKSTRKFVCLNDNMDPDRSADENELIKSILLDFYLSLFPKPSKFELPDDYRNRFVYVEELEEWRRAHTTLKLLLVACATLLCFLTFYNLCRRKMIRRIKNIIYLYRM